MTVLIAGLLFLTAASGTLVVLTRDPRRQIFVLSVNGLVLSLLFFGLQAPDVSFSEIAVGSVVVPLLYLVTLAALKMNHARSMSRAGVSADE